MKKKAFTAVASAAGLSLAFAMTSFAGQWVQDEKGWRYQEYDGSYIYTPMEIQRDYITEVVDEVNGFAITSMKTIETEKEPVYRVSCCIDGNKDGIAEIYYFGLDGYLLTNTTVKNGRGEEYRVNGDGARLDKNGNVEIVPVVQGAIDPSIGKGVLTQSYINLLLSDLQTLESSIVVRNKMYSPGYDGEVSVSEEYKSTTCVGFTLVGDKVVKIGGYKNELLTNPEMTAYEVSQGLGIWPEEDWYTTLGGGQNVMRTWTLQENPKVTLKMRDSLMWINVE